MTFPDGYRLPRDPDALLAECDVSVFQASGPGGQHRNRSRTAVRLLHRPSGIVVIGRRERSQRRNLRDALARLAERVAAALHEPKPRKATKRSRGAKERRLEEKKRRGEVKKLRSKPEHD